MSYRRVLVLGHAGFIGARVMAQLAALYPQAEAIGLSFPETDITTPEGAAQAAALIDSQTSVVMLAAIKRQLGDTPDIYLQNTAIMTAFANLIAAHPPGRVAYLSSGAVYGEDVENLAITEETPHIPRSYYGLSKITAEFMLAKFAEAQPACAVGVLRPATIYGPGDLATAYGPSGFLDAAVTGRPLTLWGDGSELRELIYIEDVARLIAQYALMDHRGPLNLVAGRSYSFRDALAAVEKAAGRLPEINERPRSKQKVDNAYNNSRLRALFPDFAFTSLDEGVRLTYAQRYAAG